MAIHFTIETDTGQVYTQARETITLDEAVAHLQAKAAAQVLTHPEIFDARDVLLDFTPHELQELAEEVRQAFAQLTPGPIAVVTNSAFVNGLAQTYATLMADHNPHFKIFGQIREAREWLTLFAEV